MKLARMANIGGAGVLLLGGSLWAAAPGCGGDDEATGSTGPATGGSASGGSGSGATGGAGASGGQIGGDGGNAAEGGGGAGGGGGDCSGDTHLCGTECVPNSDPAYACGDPSCLPCAVPHATAGCADAACSVASCDAGYQDCNGMPGDGCETNTDNDPDNCSSCGNVCPGGTAAICDMGSCGISNCSPGTADCDADPSTCETDTTSSVSHCGFCNNQCDVPNATPLCSGSQCVIGTCNGGFDDCDGTDGNGCEVNLDTNPGNCGVCGKTCASNLCSGGSCVVVCGDGVIEGSEQCDDGDTENLDGCDSGCRYESVQRVTSILVQNAAAPSWCVPATNRFGSALTDSAKDSFNGTLKADVDSGTLNILMQYLSLEDLTGQNDAAFEIGMLSAALDPSKGGSWSAGAIDWWFTAAPAGLDGNGLPVERIKPGSISSGAMQAGPNTTAIFFLGSFLTMRDARARATIGSASDVPAPPPPGLAPGLTAFQTASAASAMLGLCGNLTVSSLNSIPAPESLTTNGPSTSRCRESCGNSHQYIYCGLGNPVGPNCNSLLDVIVGGCESTLLCIDVIKPRQPDVGAGSNPPATLTNNSANINKVTIVEPNDAYSSWFQFSTNRAHLTNNL